MCFDRSLSFIINFFSFNSLILLNPSLSCFSDNLISLRFLEVLISLKIEVLLSFFSEDLISLMVSLSFFSEDLISLVGSLSFFSEDLISLVGSLYFFYQV